MATLRFTAILLGILTFSAVAQTPASPAITGMPYAHLVASHGGVINFDGFPQRSEPGINLNAKHREGAAWVGQNFAGQQMGIKRDHNGAEFDDLIAPLATTPLQVLAGPPGENMAVALHRGFGSNAVFPLGPHGFDHLSGRGEGALAVLFDHDQAMVGFRLHTDYPDPLGQNGRRMGGIQVLFFDRQGNLLGAHRHQPDRGISELAFQRMGLQADIAGILILNQDPGGIAIDDILYQSVALIG